MPCFGLNGSFGGGGQALKIRHEKKFPLTLTLGELKEKLVAFVGTASEFMRLEQHNDVRCSACAG